MTLRQSTIRNSQAATDGSQKPTEEMKESCLKPFRGSRAGRRGRTSCASPNLLKFKALKLLKRTQSLSNKNTPNQSGLSAEPTLFCSQAPAPKRGTTSFETVPLNSCETTNFAFQAKNAQPTSEANQEDKGKEQVRQLSARAAHCDAYKSSPALIRSTPSISAPGSQQSG